MVATTSGLAETLARDWTKAVWLYVRLGTTEKWFANGVRTGHDS